MKLSLYFSSVVTVISAISIACASGDSVAPGPGDRAQATFESIVMSPAVVAVEQGGAVQLDAYPSSGFGNPVSGAYSVTYSSDTPAIATVSGSGLITGMAPGAARILITVSMGNTRRTAYNTTEVFSIGPSDTVVVTGSRDGWKPSAVAVRRGRVVEWRATGDNVDRLDSLFGPLDVKDLSSGIASRRFNEAGVFQYCSYYCETAEDFFAVYVR